MLRYKTQTRPGLVALYDIRPGNGAGLFLQPRNTHGAGTAEAGRFKVLLVSFQATATIDCRAYS